MQKKELRSALVLLPETGVEGLEEFRQKHIHHPGKDVPFHVTLLPQFMLPDELSIENENKLKCITNSTEPFMFFAYPLSCFPTSRALYLSPTPITPIEELIDKIYDEFPQFGNSKKGFYISHMTIASNYEIENQQNIINEYIDRFSYQPIELTAGYIAVFCECETGEWKVYKKFKLGEREAL